MSYHADLVKLALDFFALPDAYERYQRAAWLSAEQGLGDPCLCLEDESGEALLFPFKVFSD
jgi:hypothetical protein